MYCNHIFHATLQATPFLLPLHQQIYSFCLSKDFIIVCYLEAHDFKLNLIHGFMVDTCQQLVETTEIFAEATLLKTISNLKKMNNCGTNTA